jgi:hypothetical protein
LPVNRIPLSRSQFFNSGIIPQPSPQARYNGKFLFYFVSGDEERMPMIKKNFLEDFYSM